MMNIFENFKLLKLDMEEKGWIIDAFSFSFKKVDYIVLVKLFQNNEVKKNEFALLKVEFLKVHNINDNLAIEANVRELFTDAKTLRKYFNIAWSDNIGEILSQFQQHFAKFIPKEVISSKSKLFEKAIIKSLSESDSEDPDKVYCYGVRRNPNKEKRTVFNDNKTKLLRSKLHEKFQNDDSISFCYSKDDEREKSDSEIIMNFSKS
ncbi:hypothetical protein QNZ85_004752 [Vibrio parahaemolyticus]|nr:hypothetical protein [Vibrio parahaemolyticus]